MLAETRNLLVGNDLYRQYEFTSLRHQVVIIREITSYLTISALLAAFPENFPADLYQRNSISVY